MCNLSVLSSLTRSADLPGFRTLALDTRSARARDAEDKR